MAFDTYQQTDAHAAHLRFKRPSHFLDLSSVVLLPVKFFGQVGSISHSLLGLFFGRSQLIGLFVQVSL